METMIEDLTRDNFVDLVESHEGVALVDVWGQRCQPCLVLSPHYEALADSHPDARFLKLQAEKNRMLCAQLRVLSLPTFLAFKGGEEVDRLVGDVDLKTLTRWVQTWVGGVGSDQMSEETGEKGMDQ